MDAGLTDHVWSLRFGTIGGMIGDQSREASSVRPRQYTKWKFVLGLILLIASPIRIFTVPNTPERIGYDLAGVIWWAFVIWLLWSGGFPAQSKSE
jgi:hypothetical protein